MSKLSQHLAGHFRDVFYGGNWTVTHFNEVIQDVSYEEAIRKLPNYNSIGMLVYHIHYFIGAVNEIFRGQPLNAHDKYSFDLPELKSEEEWQGFLSRVRKDCDEFATYVEQLDDAVLWEIFQDAKYGTWYRNIQGIIEHTHYHLGQIVILKKRLRETTLTI